jgi:hypothetical protein
MRDVTLSATAVAVLRFRIRGHKMPVNEQRLGAYQELVDAGIMEPDGKDFRFTEDGVQHREAILEREADRIERERYEPPDASNLSEAARALLRRRLGGEDEVTDSNQAAYRELAAARIMIPLSGFAGGTVSRYIFTYWGWCMRFDLAGTQCATEGGGRTIRELSLPSP